MTDTEKQALVEILQMITANSIAAWEGNLEETKMVVILEDFDETDKEHPEPDDSKHQHKYNGWFERLQELAGVKPQMPLNQA